MNLGRYFGVDKEEIAAALETRNPVESIYKEEGQNGEDKNINLINKIPCSENEESTIINRLTVNQLIEGLENKERQIIVLRFYKNKTQSEVRKNFTEFLRYRCQELRKRC